MQRQEFWKNLAELNSLLPERKIFVYRGSVDRYGFTHLLAERCGLRRPRHAFAEWIHGWIWDEDPTAESLAVSKLRRDLRLVVRSERERDALHSEGFEEVIIGGLPFAYVERQHVSRNPYALLAFPPHSAEVERLSSNQADYMDYLESQKQNFDGIYVSIFHLDWNGPMRAAAQARGLKVVKGARPDDANSLLRTRALFDAFEYVSSNTMGSHFVYALYSGCRFAFCGPMFQYDEGVLLSGGNPHGHSAKRIERIIAIQQPGYLKARFGEFFVENPRHGVQAEKLAREELGERFILRHDQIVNVLGWTLRGQLNGYAQSMVRRLKRRLARD